MMETDVRVTMFHARRFSVSDVEIFHLSTATVSRRIASRWGARSNQRVGRGSAGPNDPRDGRQTGLPDSYTRRRPTRRDKAPRSVSSSETHDGKTSLRTIKNGAEIRPTGDERCPGKKGEPADILRPRRHPDHFEQTSCTDRHPAVSVIEASLVEESMPDVGWLNCVSVLQLVSSAPDSSSPAIQSSSPCVVDFCQ